MMDVLFLILLVPEGFIALVALLATVEEVEEALGKSEEEARSRTLNWFFMVLAITLVIGITCGLVLAMAFAGLMVLIKAISIIVRMFLN